jgi:hypothetical protein
VDDRDRDNGAISTMPEALAFLRKVLRFMVKSPVDQL